MKMYTVGTYIIVAMLLITFLAPIASANEDERLIADEITTSNVYSLLLKAENKDQDKILQYIDELKLSTEEKAELKKSYRSLEPLS